MKKVAVLLSLMTGLSAYAGIDVIYGEDNRRDTYAETDPTLLTLSKSVAAMVHKNQIGTFRFMIDQSFQGMPSRYEICSTERFINQKSIANCSGSLIAPDKILTASHCVETKKDCNKYRWVFDYKMTNEDTLDLSYRNKMNVYECKAILASSPANKLDFAIIQLDRPVTDRLPLKVNFEKLQVSEEKEIAVIGYPSGLPQKIADNAKIKEVVKFGCKTNLDTYGGNSGSPVFDKSSGDIIGILLRGQDDFIFDSTNKCFRSNVCRDDGYRCIRNSGTRYEFVGASADLPIAEFVEN